MNRLQLTFHQATMNSAAIEKPSVILSNCGSFCCQSCHCFSAACAVACLSRSDGTLSSRISIRRIPWSLYVHPDGKVRTDWTTMGSSIVKASRYDVVRIAELLFFDGETLKLVPRIGHWTEVFNRALNNVILSRAICLSDLVVPPEYVVENAKRVHREAKPTIK